MFGRKQEDENEGDKKPVTTATTATVLEATPPLALKQRTQAQAPGQVPPSSKAPLSHPEAVRRSDTPTRRTESTESKMLIVGRDITLSGEINACDRLVVEGRVEAKLNDCREIEIASTGAFAGAANIDIADVSGSFDGTLTTREYLIIRATGRVTGTVRFRQLEVERGGQVCGDVLVLDGAGVTNIDTLKVDQKVR
jgi:cytoskeletal protein CcmA (bactofilin family)